MPLLASFLFLQWCFIYYGYVAQKFNRIVYFSLWQFFSCLVCRYKVKSVCGCWYCKNHRLSFILFYSSPISAFKVNLRPFGSMSLLLSYKNKFTPPAPMQPSTEVLGMRRPCWSSYLCDTWVGPSAVPSWLRWENGPGHQLKQLSCWSFSPDALLPI